MKMLGSQLIILATLLPSAAVMWSAGKQTNVAWWNLLKWIPLLTLFADIFLITVLMPKGGSLIVRRGLFVDMFATLFLGLGVILAITIWLSLREAKRRGEPINFWAEVAERMFGKRTSN